MAWPKTVPVLTADDIHKGTADSVDGKRHCLWGWKWCIFSGPEFLRASDAMHKYTGGKCITDFNDSTKNSKTKIAQVWNRAMADRGNNGSSKASTDLPKNERPALEEGLEDTTGAQTSASTTPISTPGRVETDSPIETEKSP